MINEIDIDEVKPSIIPTLYDTVDKFVKFGLSRDDLVTLIQRKTKQSRKSIIDTLDALQQIEWNLKKAETS